MMPMHHRLYTTFNLYISCSLETIGMTLLYTCTFSDVTVLCLYIHVELCSTSCAEDGWI